MNILTFQETVCAKCVWDYPLYAPPLPLFCLLLQIGLFYMLMIVWKDIKKKILDLFPYAQMFDHLHSRPIFMEVSAQEYYGGT